MIAAAARLVIAAALGASGAAAAVPQKIEMVNIPGGTFRMGDLAGDGRPAERPVRTVRIAPFRMGKYEVTVAQFRRFIAATGYQTEAERDVLAIPTAILGCGAILDGRLEYRDGMQWDKMTPPPADDEPVTCVSWNDAQEYVRWLSRVTKRRFRLPSEAEAEYAARAGSTTRYGWGDEADGGCLHANGADLTPMPTGNTPPNTGASRARMNCTDGYYRTAPVGRFRPNRFGLYDISGNIREWTQDCWNATFEGAPTDGSPWIGGDCLRRVARGSSWSGSPDNMRASARGSGVTPARDDDMGFRLVEDC